MDAEPSHQNVIITEAARNSIQHREKLYESMFEFGFQGCYVAV